VFSVKGRQNRIQKKWKSPALLVDAKNSIKLEIMYLISKILKLTLILISFTNVVFAQLSEKSVSIGLGSAYNFLPITENGFNTLGPSFYSDFSLGKSLENKFVAQLQYAKFQPYKDTIYGNDDSSPYSSKVYDLEGYYSQLSLGGAWQRNFRTNRKNRVFFELGSSMTWLRSELYGVILYDEPGSNPMISGHYDANFSFTLTIAGGMQQKFNDKFSLFEKFQGNYLLNGNSGNGFWYLNKLSEIRSNLFLHLCIGLTYNFGK